MLHTATGTPCRRATFQQLRGVLERAHDQRRAAQRILRVGEAELEVDHDDAGLLAGADRDLAVAAPLVVVAHGHWFPTVKVTELSLRPLAQNSRIHGPRTTSHSWPNL